MICLHFELSIKKVFGVSKKKTMDKYEKNKVVVALKYKQVNMQNN